MASGFWLDYSFGCGVVNQWVAGSRVGRFSGDTVTTRTYVAGFVRLSA